MNHILIRSRGYLPHLEIHGSTYFITLRLDGTLPQRVLNEFRAEVELLRKRKKSNAIHQERLKYLETKRIQDYLDKGIGECWLRNSEIAEMVKEAILHHDGVDYTSHACCIMPNHLHWILTPLRKKGMQKSDSRIVPIIQRLKSFTSHAANKILRRNGAFWSREYYDHRIRSSEQLSRLIVYTLENPVKARLCSYCSEWPWSFCSQSLKKALSSYL